MPSRLSTADREQQRKRDLATIHKLAAQLGMDTADRSASSSYRSMLSAVGGSTSAAELGPEGRRRVIGHLLNCVRGTRRSLSQREFIELLWLQLGQAGKLDDPTPGGLAKFIHGMHGVHLASGLNSAQANRTIEALKAWKARGAATRA
jgi:hypothetical protein